MLQVRHRKVIRDLLSNKSRTALVVIAIAVGVFAFGSVFITQEVLLKNIDDQYKVSNASNVSVFLSDFDKSLITWVKTQPGISEVDGKSSRNIKIIFDNDDEESINIISVPDFGKITLNKLEPKRGKWPPQKGEIILERNSLNNSNIRIGDKLRIKTDKEKEYALTLTGSVYDNSAIPYLFTNQMTGFVSQDTLGMLGYSKRFNKLEIKTAPDIKTLSDAERVTFNITEILEDRGEKVFGTQVFKPNQHWATDNSKAFTAILSVIGVFSLVLSGFLVINTISALLSQQKKQVGIMKAVGASRKQIITLYLLMVGFYGILAFFVALPVGMFLGYFFLTLVTDFLNMDIETFFLPFPVFMMQLASALIVPTIAAFIPIVQGTKKSVREVISDYQPTGKTGKFDKVLIEIKGLSRPLLISIRNVFRKKARLALTLGTLVTAGALFIGVINVRNSMYEEMDRILQMYDFEVSVSLGDDYPVNTILNRINQIPEVSAVEARTHISARRIKPDGSKGAQFSLSGLPPETIFSHPVLLSGRWLNETDKDNVVISSTFQRDNPDLSVGSELPIALENENYRLQVIGVIAVSGNQNENFSDFNTVSKIKDKPNVASGYLMKTQPNDPVTQEKVGERIKEILDTSGISVSGTQTKNEIYTSAASQFNFLIFFLLMMAVMVAVVGGLGLAGTMSLNVLERTREIGILRSVGAGDQAVRKLVLTEGLLVGLISWILAIPMSLPLTWGFCIAIGNAFFERTLIFTFIPLGMVIWLIIIFVIAVIASIIPANRASKMSINETLAYE